MQLTNLNIKQRLALTEFKADLVAFDNKEILLNKPAADTRKMFAKLIEIEPEFLLVDKDILKISLEVVKYNYDKKTLGRLEPLANISRNTKEKLATGFLNKERFKHGYYFDKEEYLDLVYLEDMLLKETDATVIADNPYLLYAANYLKYTYKDYYDENIAASYYLYILLLELKNSKKIDENISSKVELCLQDFAIASKDDKKTKEKIITLKRKR